MKANSMIFSLSATENLQRALLRQRASPAEGLSVIPEYKEQSRCIHFLPNKDGNFYLF